MQARFVLGPAGSGKTFRCLAEIRAALAAAPDGPPLIFIAPKQATFQLERQLLGGGKLSAFTRLHVLSFDRLAGFVFECLRVAPPRLLSAEGRLMVLRALLRRHEGELKLLGRSARRAGFAQELGGQLAELRRQRIGPARLRALAADESMRPHLRQKLEDLALIAEAYGDWLGEHDLQDANCLLDFATSRLRAEVPGNPNLAIGHLWMDGFAEMTPQEHALLAAVMPFCQGATLAFCLDTEPTPSDSWLSIWSAIGKTFCRCRDQIAAIPGCQARTEVIGRRPGQSRFAPDSALAALEEGWCLPVAGGFEPRNLASEISVAACPDPEGEAVYAARELLRFVRGGNGNRFRDCAVLVRNLENYHQALARVFRRYGIPFFLDRREGVSHHPLAELTRSALRTVAGDWSHDDWFAALKAGFAPAPEEEIDRLENLALEFGWRGRQWREPLPDEGAERLRTRIMPPYEKLFTRLQRLKFEPTGIELAEAIGGLWDALEAEATLARWAQAEAGDIEAARQGSPAGANPGAGGWGGSVHQTVLEQMNAWLENVARAFPRERMPLREWLPVLETGLVGLTVGVIPPALDEVLVGAIDRARNPDLKFALLLGMNESVFPAAPVAPVILTNSDRDDLDKQNVTLGLNPLDQISRERYLGYIACTRSNRRLALAFSRQDAAGRTLNPSPFITHLRGIFPRLPVAETAGEADWREAEHANELVTPLARSPAAGREAGTPTVREPEWDALTNLPAISQLLGRLAQLREPDKREGLSPRLAEAIHGAVLKSSVSRLEEFASCPFRFFVHSSLRAEERKQFELDARERGSFQHEVLKAFHDEVTAEGKRWRDVTPDEARERIRRIAGKLAPDYREGLLRADDRSRFAAGALTAALEEFVATLAQWMRGQYDFDPAKAETGFGLDQPGLPAWSIDLAGGHQLALRGRVDRIDLCRLDDRALVVVMDYKSGARKLDKVLMSHGVQLQLLGYLAAVRSWPAEFFGVKKLTPAGVFYVNLRGQFEGASTRAEALADWQADRRLAYRHTGRFDAGYLPQLDRTRAGDQFSYRLKQDGGLYAGSTEAISCKEFTGLIDQVEEQLRILGNGIYSGAAAVEPYRKGGATACDFCDYRAICRFDEWTHEFRELRAVE